MKRTEIILIILVAIVASIIIATFTSSNENLSFNEAKTKIGDRVKVTGTFDKTSGFIYEPEKNPNRTVFFVIDKENVKNEVELIQKDGKPMGLEQSESVTMEGSMGSDGIFHADFVLLKCPSKYNEQKHQTQ
jgi:cytochrome c-type biogenesis protein CcmE